MSPMLNAIAMAKYDTHDKLISTCTCSFSHIQFSKTESLLISTGESCSDFVLAMLRDKCRIFLKGI